MQFLNMSWIKKAGLEALLRKILHSALYLSLTTKPTPEGSWELLQEEFLNVVASSAGVNCCKAWG
jgi:hypothetical protein